MMQVEDNFCALVSNIPYQANPNQLRFLFESNDFTIQRLSCPYTMERTDAGLVKMYKGHAFVHFPDGVQMQRAIETMNGTELLGRILTVRAKSSNVGHAGEKEKRHAAGNNDEQPRATKPKVNSRADGGERTNEPKLYTRFQDDGDYNKQVFCSRSVLHAHAILNLLFISSRHL